MFAKGSGIESVPLRYHANEVVGLVECAGKLEELLSFSCSGKLGALTSKLHLRAV